MITTAIKATLIAPYYTRQNLEIVLGTNRRTLDYRIASLISDGILEKVKSGFYINKMLFELSNQKDEFMEYVGSVVRYPSYVSLEYALSGYGLIPEGIFTITYVTTKKPGTCGSKFYSFKYRSIKPILFSEYETRTFGKATYFFAKRFKALFDFIYLTPLKNQSEIKRLLLESRINWNVLTNNDKNEFIKICATSKSKKMERVVKILAKERTL